MKKMLDDVFIKILSETKASKWMSMPKLRGILHDYLQEKAKAELVMDFLEKYFIDVNNDKSLVRLNDLANKLFEKPL